jgi:hypothetical protein
MFSGIGKQVFHELEGVHGLRSQLPARPETTRCFHQLTSQQSVRTEQFLYIDI